MKEIWKVIPEERTLTSRPWERLLTPGASNSRSLGHGWLVSLLLSLPWTSTTGRFFYSLVWWLWGPGRENTRLVTFTTRHYNPSFYLWMPGGYNLVKKALSWRCHGVHRFQDYGHGIMLKDQPLLPPQSWDFTNRL